jgi:fumarate reductase iron-sulfur subunit
MTASRSLTVTIWRGGESGRARPTPFRVPVTGDPTVLDLVTAIQRDQAPDLGYRFSCRVGMCGSCAMMVNGRPRWTCRTRVSLVVRRGGLELAPLAGLPVVKDLAVDMTPFFEKWVAAGGAFRPCDSGDTALALIAPDSPARRAAAAAIECIGCGVCTAACRVARAEPDYPGPAALNRVWTLVNDARDADGAQRLAELAGPGGVFTCHSQGACTDCCPKGLDPRRSIAGLKRAAALAALKGAL